MMNNAEMFLKTFGIYATELWATSESDFLKWLNAVWQKEKPMDDLIYRKDAIGVLSAQCYRGTDFEDVCGKDCECAEYMAMRDLPSAQSEDWMERNKERILQAGMEGREIEFRIGGRLFAIREKAQ